ncbi:unnamed protein product [Nezara viridula]|uniref:LanC-like protein 2 n=1 Tax=Nezara viridula TaxID=85310 RepID=A0A9P0MVJ2_NEZVI|nr:unnamed protein product [Nezara viridula]
MKILNNILLKFFPGISSIVGVKFEMDHSRFFKNPYEDFSPQSATKFLNGKQFKSDLVSHVQKLDGVLLDKIQKNINRISFSEDYTIYVGYCGIALLYLLKYKRTNDTIFLQKAKGLTEKGLSQLRQDDISFLLGDAGPLALAAVVNFKLGDQQHTRQCIQRLIDLPTKVNSSPPYELLYGRVGYLYALLFVENEIGPIIPVEVIKDCIEAIIKGGQAKAQSTNFPAPLQYEWYNTNYLGAAHGVAGILYVLLCANQFLTEVQRQQIIKPTIDWLKENRFPSGNFKSSYGRDRDSLVHWCHGSPGFVYLFMLAHKVYNNQEYKDLALQCGDVVWHRGILKKGYSICHGVSGNAYTFLYLYKTTRDLKYLYQAACFLDWCTTYPMNEGRKPDTPYSLFEGIAGLDYFLTDVLNPEDANFPAFALL